MTEEKLDTILKNRNAKSDLEQILSDIDNGVFDKVSDAFKRIEFANVLNGSKDLRNEISSIIRNYCINQIDKLNADFNDL